MNSLAFDFEVRSRLGGNSLIWAVLAETAIPTSLRAFSSAISRFAINLCCPSIVYAREWIQFFKNTRGQFANPWRKQWASTDAERSRLRIILDALSFALAGLSIEHASWMLRDCDHPLAGFQVAARSFDPNGFWRVDKDKDPELRHTVLSLIAFHDLEEKIREHGADREAGIEAFLSQNNGEGWLLPETVRLADYGLGHDDRALEHQPVASRLGPRFYDWQLAQTAEESWRECHLHARNLLGEAGYQNLLAEIEAERTGQKPEAFSPLAAENPARDDQQLPLFS